MRRREQVLALVASVLAGGVGYTAHAGSESRDALDRTSVVDPRGVNKLALLTGSLGGDAGTGCLWVEHQGHRTALVLEHMSAGVNFATSPPAVETEDGVVARFGDAVSLGGGLDSDVAVPGCAPLGTPFRAWKLEKR